MTIYSTEHNMTARGLTMQLNMPPALKGNSLHDLPPYEPVEMHDVDQYPDCPVNWEHGSDKASSYFCAVQEGKGLWLDFNQSYESDGHDVAVVVSVQGVNAITGQATPELNLEKYEKTCPVHHCDFEGGRYCPQCKYKWPAQNYLASTGTPAGIFWLDGFRTQDGKVRQYIVTPEESRGVATHVVGADRVYAVGVAFYRSKERKQRPRTRMPSKSIVPAPASKMWKMGAMGGGASLSCNVPKDRGGDTYNAAEFNLTDADNSEDTQFEIGAGAQIAQQVYDDPKPIEYWQPEPYAMVYINYESVAKVKAILAAGKRDEKAEGPLTGIPVGNP